MEKIISVSVLVNSFNALCAAKNLTGIVHECDKYVELPETELPNNSDTLVLSFLRDEMNPDEVSLCLIYRKKDTPFGRYRPIVADSIPHIVLKSMYFAYRI